MAFGRIPNNIRKIWRINGGSDNSPGLRFAGPPSLRCAERGLGRDL